MKQMFEQSEEGRAASECYNSRTYTCTCYWEQQVSVIIVTHILYMYMLLGTASECYNSHTYTCTCYWEQQVSVILATVHVTGKRE